METLRDNYIKYINQEKKYKSGSGATKRKKYHFADMLSFLKPNLERRSTSGNFTNDTQVDQQVSDTDDQVDDHNALLDTSQQLDMSTTSAQNTLPSTSKKNKKNTKMTDFQSKLLNHLEKQETTDADEHFLKSLLPEVKKLSESKKLDFKVYVLKFFQNESRPQNYNYSYPTAVFQQQNNTPYFHPGLNSLNSSSPMLYQQASQSQSSIDTLHHITYSESVPTINIPNCNHLLKTYHFINQSHNCLLHIISMIVINTFKIYQ
ncbi:uncharacterized protein LOC126554158 [Aphis gossypii]|uniref:uncharacterized protein LOC126554158 n=1 Tax=Aphis gossypii TaxID=80765 RepID=UPI0021597765|nr:uncharacterized protein LOC126554158 [Aphis gossypii]